MKDTIYMSKKIFYLIVSLCALIIMANSIEAFIKVKDLGLFETWLANPKLNIDRSQNTNQIYSIYLTMCLSIFIMRIITPVALGLNTYFAFIKTKVNKLFVFIWIILLVGLFIFTSIGEVYFSIFFIINAICHVGLLFIMIHLLEEINKQRNIIIAEKIN